MKSKILFVDDEERIVNLLRMLFRSSYEVFTATDGQKALEIVEAHPIDVVVSDQRMPGMQGIELLTEIRKRSPNTMRILLTGYSDLTAIIGSVNEAEVFRFINKPWDHEEIKAVVAEAAGIAKTTASVTIQTRAMIAEQELGQEGSGGNGEGEVLVLDADAKNRIELVALLGSHYKVHGATSVAEALEKLQSQNIGVLVSEASIGNEDGARFLSLLKRHYPIVTTVMLTSVSDADVVTGLINRAQIYRFLPKPTRPNVLLLAVSGAMKQHRHFRENPNLLLRNKVDAREGAGEVPLSSSVRGYFAALREKFSLFKR